MYKRMINEMEGRRRTKETFVGAVDSSCRRFWFIAPGDLLQFRGATQKIMKFYTYQYEAQLIGTALLNRWSSVGRYRTLADSSHGV
jgi:hypothetical protein